MSPAESSRPRVTIALPVFNDQRFIGAAVESMLAQTFRDFELLVVDDGSTDETPAILARFTDPRLRVIRQPNSGICVALNRALREARGEYFARMDSDDVSRPDRLERQVRFLEENSGVGLVGSACEVVHENGTHLMHFRTPTTDDAIRRAMVRYNPIVHSSVVARSSLLRDAGGYDEALSRMAHDYDLWWRLAPRTRFANLPEELVTRVHRDAGPFRIQKSRHYRECVRLQTRALRRHWAPAIPLIAAIGEAATLYVAHRAIETAVGGTSYLPRAGLFRRVTKPGSVR